MVHHHRDDPSLNNDPSHRSHIINMKCFVCTYARACAHICTRAWRSPANKGSKEEVELVFRDHRRSSGVARPNWPRRGSKEGPPICIILEASDTRSMRRFDFKRSLSRESAHSCRDPCLGKLDYREGRVRREGEGSLMRISEIQHAVQRDISVNWELASRCIEHTCSWTKRKRVSVGMHCTACAKSIVSRN
jgi:hypothetical protein